MTKLLMTTVALGLLAGAPAFAEEAADATADSAISAAAQPQGVEFSADTIQKVDDTTVALKGNVVIGANGALITTDTAILTITDETHFRIEGGSFDIELPEDAK
ncbi:hypothetical protein FJU08_12375 [Martelella alba]|uniref:Lipopolysaccharide export system protein LptA n=1 Tax=Martelella alba TaxID=2590451 RepID=A0A506U6V8_9HYPH|nr:hypothetical protein [Martelella alba]TPW30113.1 hypothetical protein FJU08_12375 [Martelella alba]